MNTPFDLVEARQLLQVLVQGLDPFNACELPPDTLMRHPQLKAAFLAAVVALDSQLAHEHCQPHRPANVGRKWTEEEERALSELFRRGETFEAIATHHGRSRMAIEYRLEKLGLISPRG